MSRYKISLQSARRLQRWALKESGAGELLKNVPKFPKTKKIKPGLYVDYGIDESELDGGMDWPDIGVASIYAVFENGEKIYLGEIRAYNGEAIWLSTTEDDEVDTAENWWELINEEYNKLLNSKGIIK